MIEQGELWSAIIRYDRRAGDVLRVRVPCSSPERARWLCQKIGGHVEKGAVVATGRGVPGLLRALGQDEGIVEKTLLYRYASGEERRRLLDEIFEAVRPDTPRGHRILSMEEAAKTEFPFPSEPEIFEAVRPDND